MAIDTSGGHPSMDYREHVATYRGFVRTVVWVTALIAITLILMAIFLL
jgi:hypothetical protein